MSLSIFVDSICNYFIGNSEKSKVSGELGLIFGIPQITQSGKSASSCFSKRDHLYSRMSSLTKSDLFAEVRKHATSRDQIKSENYRVLESIEKSISTKKNIKVENITPLNYFFAIMTQLNTRTPKCRSVTI